MLLFSCDDFETSIGMVDLESSQLRKQLSATDLDVNSCDSLVRVCVSNMSHFFNATELSLIFKPRSPSEWAHIAEVIFYDDNSTCPPDTIIAPTAGKHVVFVFHMHQLHNSLQKAELNNNSCGCFVW